MSPEKGRLNAVRVKEEFEQLKRKCRSELSRACPVPGKNPVFSGRTKILSNLKSLLISDSRDHTITKPLSIVLYGIPGTGKKSIITELCHLFVDSARFPRGIYWFRADSKRILKSSYSRLRREKNLERTKDGKLLELKIMKTCLYND